MNGIGSEYLTGRSAWASVKTFIVGPAGYPAVRGASSDGEAEAKRAVSQANQNTYAVLMLSLGTYMSRYFDDAAYSLTFHGADDDAPITFCWPWGQPGLPVPTNARVNNEVMLPKLGRVQVPTGGYGILGSAFVSYLECQPEADLRNMMRRLCAKFAQYRLRPFAIYPVVSAVAASLITSKLGFISMPPKDLQYVLLHMFAADYSTPAPLHEAPEESSVWEMMKDLSKGFVVYDWDTGKYDRYDVPAPSGRIDRDDDRLIIPLPTIAAWCNAKIVDRKALLSTAKAIGLLPSTDSVRLSPFQGYHTPAQQMRCYIFRLRGVEAGLMGRL